MIFGLCVFIAQQVLSGLGVENKGCGLSLEKGAETLQSKIRTLTDHPTPKLDKSPPHGKMFTFYSQEGCFVKSYVYGFSYLYGSERRTTKR